MKTADAGVLSVAYDEYGPADGWPCILGHGFPYDPHAYAEAAPHLDAVPVASDAALRRAGGARR